VGGGLLLISWSVIDGCCVVSREGLSEYWWMRIRQGQREQISDPTPIPDPSSRHSAGAHTDPRLHFLTEEDIGCTFKVKGRPLRSDGDRVSFDFEMLILILLFVWLGRGGHFKGIKNGDRDCGGRGGGRGVICLER